MTTEIITRFVEDRPFIQFEICLADGRTVQVRHSDFVTLERFALAITVLDDTGIAEIIDVALIVSIRTLQPV